MTAQAPEKFVNEHPRVRTEGLRLYFVSAELPVKPVAPADQLRSTALWRGYVATWLLNGDGTLELVQFEYPHFKRDPVIQKVAGGLVKGDFTLTFRPFFQGPNTEVPFENGRVVEDRSAWQMDDQALETEVLKPLDQSGLIVRTIGGLGFIPKSFLAPDANLESMIGDRFKCELFDRDERGRLILKPT